jgi:hypothetical protein
MGRVFFDTRKNVHELTAATYQCLASDSGKTFVLNSTSAMTITLPADADISEGWNCRFYVKTANDNAYTINCSDMTDSTGQMFEGGIAVASTTAGFGHGVAAAANDSQIVLDGNLANGAGEPGSYENELLTKKKKVKWKSIYISWSKLMVSLTLLKML